MNLDGVDILVLRTQDDVAEGTTTRDGEIIPYYVLEKDGILAGGETRHKARRVLQNKIFASRGVERRIEEFVSKCPPDARYTVDEWLELFQNLTGACAIGGLQFIREKGYKRYEVYSTIDFLNAVGDSYAPELMQKVRDHYEEFRS